MKLAVIAPAAHVERLCSGGPSGPPIQLCLSHVYREVPLYKHKYCLRVAKGDYVILDNSAHELYSGNDGWGLLDIAKELNPTEVVLPDRLFFGEDTLEMSSHALPLFRREMPEVRLMGVPQGRTLWEWYACLSGLLSLGVDTIGISKDYEVWVGGLSRLVHSVPEEVQVHILGWPRNWEEVVSVQRDFGSRVRSIDTAKPVVAAMRGIIVGSGKITKPAGYFEEALSETVLKEAESNIQAFREVCGECMGTKEPNDAAYRLSGGGPWAG